MPLSDQGDYPIYGNTPAKHQTQPGTIPETGLYTLAIGTWAIVDHESILPCQVFHRPTYDINYLLRAIRGTGKEFKGQASVPEMLWILGEYKKELEELRDKDKQDEDI